MGWEVKKKRWGGGGGRRDEWRKEMEDNILDRESLCWKDISSKKTAGWMDGWTVCVK